MTAVEFAQSTASRHPFQLRPTAVESFVALRAHIDTWRWAGVPFFIRAGKRLATTTTEVMVRLRRPPEALWPDGPGATPNYVRFELSPAIAISLGARVKSASLSTMAVGTTLTRLAQPRRTLG